MSHITIVINAVTPSHTTGLGTAPNQACVPPTFSLNVNYAPPDGMTPAQIGNEVARIQRHINQIIGVPAD